MVWFALIDIVEIRGASMSPTLHDRQVVIVNRAAYGLHLFGRYIVRWDHPNVGDIVVYRSPLDGRAVAKRCIAIGRENGTVLLIGDNRSVSIDSRHYGTVAIEAIYGRVLLTP